MIAGVWRGELGEYLKVRRLVRSGAVTGDKRTGLASGLAGAGGRRLV